MIAICYNIKVHVTGNTVGSVISDTICCFFNLFMAVVSICSNVLVIRVYTCHASGRTIGNLLFASLSMTETIKAGLVQPAFFIWKIMEVAKLDFCYPYLFTILGNNFCSLSAFMHICFLITIERCISVYKPILHQEAIVRKSFMIAACFTQILCAVVLLTMFFTSQHRIYFIAMCLLVVVCLTGTAVTYVKIGAKMRKTPITRNKVCLFSFPFLLFTSFCLLAPFFNTFLCLRAFCNLLSCLLGCFSIA